MDASRGSQDDLTDPPIIHLIRQAVQGKTKADRQRASRFIAETLATHDRVKAVREKVVTALLQEIREMPISKHVSHCGKSFQVSPFEYYATCPKCQEHIKVRGISGHPDIEDVFDAVFAWLHKPGASAIVERRRQQLNDDL